MYAIVEIAGQQFKVEEGQEIFVHRLQAEEGDNLSFDEVLLTDNDGDVAVGKPTVAGVSVNATVLGHLKGDKVIVFKKKRRKGYKTKNGHRQHFTKISIDSIGSGVAPRAAKMASAAPVQADDLTKVEGIGPKISELLQNAGVNTFADLASQSEDALKTVLKGGGSRFAMKNPSTWAKQADMAANGQWDELKKWQDILDGGIEK
jgi:large subunit ribosomal protein L21